MGQEGLGGYRGAGGWPHLKELFTFIPHLLPDAAALSPQVVAEVDGVDGGTGLLVQRGLLPNPVVDLPVQGTVLIQEGLGRTECEMRWLQLQPGDVGDPQSSPGTLSTM